MSSLSNVGNLMHLYLDEIEEGDPVRSSAFVIKAAANLLAETGGRNWIPVIVKEIDRDRYQVIGNSFVYAVVKEAGLERIWCIVADSDPGTIQATQILAQEKVPKVNLSTASFDQIRAALQYLTEDPKLGIKGLDISKVANRIDEAPDRPFWKSLDPLTTLKCSITAAKLKAFEQVFYLRPAPLPTPPPLPSAQALKKMKVSELKELAKQRDLAGYSKLKKADLVQALLNF